MQPIRYEYRDGNSVGRDAVLLFFVGLATGLLVALRLIKKD